MLTITYLITSKWHPVDEFIIYLLAVIDAIIILGSIFMITHQVP